MKIPEVASIIMLVAAAGSTAALFRRIEKDERTPMSPLAAEAFRIAVFVTAIWLIF